MRDRILDATLRVVADAGVDGVTHRRVAAEAGVSVGSTTRHFTSRDEMIREAFGAYMDRARADALAFHEVDAVHTSGDDLARTIAAWSARIGGDQLEVAEYELLVLASRDPSLAGQIRSWHAVLDGVLAARLEALDVAEPLAGARAVRAVLRGSELDRLSTGDPGLEEITGRIRAVIAGLPRRTPSPDPTPDPTEPTEPTGPTRSTEHP